MAAEVAQPLVQYLQKILPSVIDVTKIHLMWRHDTHTHTHTHTHKPSVRLPGVILSHRKMAYFIWCVVFPAAYRRSTVTHCCVLLASSACRLD